MSNMVPAARGGAAAGPGVVEELAAAIDYADTTLAATREQQCAALEALYQQEAELEAEIEAIASRMDADLIAEAEAEVHSAEMRQAAAAARGADGPAGPSGAGARTGAAGLARAASAGRRCVLQGAHVLHSLVASQTGACPLVRAGGQRRSQAAHAAKR
jgi:hypothetical protein